jgi:hypothetical protein
VKTTVKFLILIPLIYTRGEYMLVQFYLKVIRPISSRIIFSQIASGFTQKEKEAAQKKLDGLFSSLLTIADVVAMNDTLKNRGFIWKSDPQRGILDFSPEELWLFIARKGDDCDGWAEFNYRACKKINLHPTMWVLIDGLNISTAHVVTTCKDPQTGKYYQFNNSSATTYNTEDECINIFSKKVLTATGIYKNMKKYVFKK